LTVVEPIMVAPSLNVYLALVARLLAATHVVIT